MLTSAFVLANIYIDTLSLQLLFCFIGHPKTPMLAVPRRYHSNAAQVFADKPKFGSHVYVRIQEDLDHEDVDGPGLLGFDCLGSNL